MSENKIRWTPGEHVLPMRSVRSGPRMAGLFVLLFSAVWCGFLYASLVMGTLEKGFDLPMTLLLLLFSLPGVLSFLMGLSLLLGRTETTLSSDGVETLRKGVSRSRRWKEPLRAYTGVLRRVERLQSRNHSGFTEYRILLVHPDAEKEVSLFESGSPTGWESAWHRFASLLGLPLLEESEQGIYRVDGQKLAEKSDVSRAPQEVAVRARGIEVRRQNGGYIFLISRFPAAWRGALGALVACALAVVAWKMQARFPDDTLLTVVAWLLTAFVPLALASLISDLRGMEELTVAGDRVEHRSGSGRGDRWKGEAASLPVWDVRRVTVESDPSHRGRGAMVTLEGTGDSLRLAAWRGGKVQRDLALAVAAALGEVTGKGARAFLPHIVLPGQRQRQRLAAKKLAAAMAIYFALMAPLMWWAFHDRPKPRPAGTARNETLERWRAVVEEGYADYRAGRYEAAGRKLERARVLAERLGTASAPFSITLHRLAQVEESQGRYDQAAVLAERSVEIAKGLGSKGEGLAWKLFTLASVLEKKGDVEAAEARYREVAELARQVFGDRPELRGKILRRYAAFLEARGRKDEARRIRREAGPPPPSPSEARRKVAEEARRRALEARRRAEEQARIQGKASKEDGTALPGPSGQPSDPESVEIVSLDIQALHPQRNRVPASHALATIPLTATPPPGTEEPPEAKGEAWYGELALGAGPERFPLAMVVGPSARLWLDRNRNGDFSDDGPPVETGEVSVTVPPVRKPLTLWIYTSESLWKERRLAFYNRTQLVGRPLVGGREFLVVVAERGRHDGRFDNDGLYVDANRDGEIEPDAEYVFPNGSVSLLGRRYRFRVR